MEGRSDVQHDVSPGHGVVIGEHVQQHVGKYLGRFLCRPAFLGTFPLRLDLPRNMHAGRVLAGPVPITFDQPGVRSSVGDQDGPMAKKTTPSDTNPRGNPETARSVAKETAKDGRESQSNGSQRKGIAGANNLNTAAAKQERAKNG
ncbi:hypothetical protein [Kitasatospora sp. NPDC001132]